MRKTRVAVIGVGLRGVWPVRETARRDDAELVAVCDTIPAKAQWAIRRYGAEKARVFDNAADLLEHSDCDAVFVTVPDNEHPDVAAAALAAGRFVYCEKPLAISLEGCRSVLEADARARGKTFVGMNLRYAPVYAALRRYVDAGEIGRLLTIQADEFYEGGRTYFRRWNRLRSAGGGLWLTKACHDFDLLGWFAGTRPVRVSATAARTYYVPRDGAAARCRDCAYQSCCPDRAPVEPWPPAQIAEESGGEPHDLCLYNSPSDTFDHGIATVTFEGDVLATYTCNVVTGLTDRRMRLSGTQGTLDAHLRGGTITLVKRDPTEEVQLPLADDVSDGHGGADANILGAFFRFVRGEEEPKCRPAEAVQAVRMGLAARRAADTGQTVCLDELPG